VKAGASRQWVLLQVVVVDERPTTGCRDEEAGGAVAGAGGVKVAHRRKRARIPEALGGTVWLIAEVVNAEESPLPRNPF
jgi:hypothetical protein